MKILSEFKHSLIPADRMFYLQGLKQLGKVGKKLYKLKPTEELKQNILIIFKLITEYDLYQNIKKTE